VSLYYCFFWIFQCCSVTYSFCTSSFLQGFIIWWLWYLKLIYLGFFWSETGKKRLCFQLEREGLFTGPKERYRMNYHSFEENFDEDKSWICPSA
jgi:hypothetical protein